MRQHSRIMHDAATRWKPAGLSFVLHLLVLLMLIWLIRFPPPGNSNEPLRRVSVVLADVNELNPLTHEYFDPTELPRDPQPEQLSKANAEPPPRPVSSTEIPARENIQPDIEGIVTSATDLAAPARRESGTGKMSEETLRAIAAEQAELASQPRPGPTATTSIFGSGPLVGRRFVFVIDRSKSMGSQGLGVLSLAQTELIRAVEPMTKEHSFQIVAYHQQTVTLQDAGLLSATDEHKNLVAEFVENLAPYGSTDHEAALFIALGMRPDVIVLLTDGDTPELHDGQIQDIVRATGGKTTIHTVQFGTQAVEPSETFMRKLANLTGGSYRYYNVNDTPFDR